MVRLFMVALGLAICAQFAPDSWGPLSGWADAWRLLDGRLRFVGFPPGGNAVSGTALPVGVVSQYQGLLTDNANCGPASASAILRFVRPDLAAMTLPDLVAAVRSATGEPEGDTDLAGLAQALDAFGVPSAILYSIDARDGAKDPLAALRLALTHGRPVIARVGGAALGRGQGYGDHFVVITGIDDRAGLVDVVDPDTQAPRTSWWEPGGNQQWPFSLARAALRAAGKTDAMGVVAGAQRTNAITPSGLFRHAATIVALLGLLLGLLGRYTKTTSSAH